MEKFDRVESLLTLGAITAYFLFTSWLTLRLKSKTNREFMVAARAMPPLVMGAFLMSEWIGAISTVGTSQKAFEAGFAATWSVLSACVAFVLFGRFFVARLYNSGAYTISGAIEKRYGKSTKITVSLIMIYAMLLINVGNYIGGAAALSSVMNLNLNWAIVLMALASTFYFTLGGMKGVAWVTIVHTGMKVLGLAIIASTALYLTKGFSPMIASLPKYYFSWDGKIGGATMLAWFVGVAGAMFSSQHVVQAVLSNKSAKDAELSCYYSALFCLPVGLMLGITGVAAKFLYPHMNSLFALPIFLTKVSPFLGALIATSLVASVFVSVSTVALGITSLMVQDFYLPWAKPAPGQQLRATRWLSLAVGLLPLIFVFFAPGILKLSFFTRALRLSVTIVGVTGLSLPFFSSGAGATWGLIAATIATTAWFLMGDPLGIDNIYVAVVTPLIVMGVDNILRHRFAERRRPAE